jgi:hypothetical protein
LTLAKSAIDRGMAPDQAAVDFRLDERVLEDYFKGDRGGERHHEKRQRIAFGETWETDRREQREKARPLKAKPRRG